MLRQADIIRYNVEQVDVPISSWPPLPEEVDYHHVSNQKIVQLVRTRYYLQYAQWKDQKTEFVQYTITTKRKIGYRLMLDSVNHLGHSVFNEKVNNIEIQFAELNFKKSE